MWLPPQAYLLHANNDTSRRKVVHQVPDGAIVPSPSAPPGTVPLFDFNDVSFFVIPRQELCGNLIHVCNNGYRILGFPICMKSPQYDRNEFIFNFCIVLREGEEWATYKSVTQKLADLMCGLEEQSGFLSKDTSKGGEGKVYSLCETLMEDLNNYCECMIPIDKLNTLNIKLFPLYPSPPIVKAWHVPLFTVRYEAFMDENWDLTMQRVVPYINGVNSIRKISKLADADFALTCSAIRHLIYYGCVFLLDIFSFSATYAPTAQFGSTIASDEEMQRECARYVNTRFANIGPIPSPIPAGGRSSSITGLSSNSIPRSVHGVSTTSVPMPDEQDIIWPKVDQSIPAASQNKLTTPNLIVDGVGIIELYASLRQGQTVKQWYLKHMQELANIDVRRFITFGIIKGFLYRAHKYPFATEQFAKQHQPHFAQGTTPNSLPSISTATGSSVSGGTATLGSFTRDRLGSVASGIEPTVAPPGSVSIASRRQSTSASSFHERRHTRQRRRRYQDGDDGDEEISEEEGKDSDEEEEWDSDEDRNYGIDDKTLGRYLDGNHCFDQICTELEISDKELTARLKRYPREVVIITS
ncbi:Nitrogen permease regulator 2 [Myotisia sp. PD_48]|nr:Nitrogen permease regulator 2 [Myotisia sp. PD_48]